MKRFILAKYHRMKNLKLRFTIKAIVLFAFISVLTSIGAYSQTCEVTLRNDSLIDANNLIVDIYVKATSGDFYYAQGQYRISFNSSILNGGTISGSVVTGYSDLTNSIQLPASIIVSNTNYYWRATTGTIPSTQALCSQISAVGNGTRICRVRLTNTAAFGVISPNMTLVTTAPGTAVWYLGSDDGLYQATSYLVNTNLTNPILNSTLTVYNVTGGGTAPAVVGLDNSQTGGVNYILYNGATPQGSAVDGTGFSITFGNQSEGSYTVKAHRKATYMYQPMTGTVIVNAACVPVTIGTQPSANIMCAVTGSASLSLTPNGTAPFTYQWQYNNAGTWEIVTNGTPSGSSYTNATAITLNVSGITTPGSYQYRCYVTNCSGANNATSTAASLTVNPGTPSQPGTITGTVTQCPGLTLQAYSISAVTNATTYTWTVPTGWSVTGGAGTTSITVTTGSAGQNGNISVTAGNSCGTSTANTLAVTVSPGTPLQPGTITGIATQCPGLTNQAYSISAVTNATTYTWIVPTGWSITGGAGTTSITVTTGSAGQNGNISVTAGNSCGTSSANTLAVTISPGTPTQPGTITGIATQCPGLTNQAYSISAVTNATTYTWTVPTGWSVTGGAGTTSITVTTGSAGQNGNISVTAGNSCGTSAARTLTVTVSPGTPLQPGTITGTATQCPGLTIQAYSISAVTNATTYTWTVPTGWSVTGGAGTTSITVTTGSAGQNGNISVTAGNSCGTSAVRTLAVTVSPGTPTQPGTITGTATQCPGLTLQAYSISAVTNATTYTWTVPTGWSITGGAGTTSITVTTGSAGQNGNISVTAGNSCGTSTASILAVTVDPGIPAAPVATAGSGATCSQITANWTTSVNATYYELDVSTVNTFATYVAGYQDLNVLNVTTYIVTGLNGGTTYYYRVRAVNSCGTSVNSGIIIYATNPGTPSQPGVITGTTPQCPGLTGQIYSISAVTGATSYTWTVPLGWSITAGSGTTSITVTTGAAGQNGNITVTANNSCGTSTPSTLAVTVSPGTPSQPGTITGTATQCPGLTLQAYSISAVTNATTYTWTVPTGWSVTGGAGTTSITVTTGSAGQNGNISVTAGNSCGTSTANTLAVTVSPGTPLQPGTITGTATQCPGLTLQAYSISAVTNATTYTWTVPTGWSVTGGAGTTSITVTTGSAGQNGNISVTAGNSCGTSATRTLAVTVSPGTPLQPGTITGTATQCPGLTLQAYSISAVTNATTYTWTVPTGWSITGGVGTTSITVTTGSAGQNGNISVTAGNSCGTSTASTLAVTVNSLSTAPAGVAITNNNTCNGISKILTVTGGSLGSGATWQWFTGSCGGTSAGTGLSIIVDPAPGTSTTYYVLASGSCNTTACASGIVVVNPAVGTPVTPTPSATTICQGSANTVYSSSAINATTYNWSVTGTGNTISGIGTNGTVIWSPGFYGTATVSVTANGCNGPSSPASTTVTVTPNPSAPTGPATQAFCSSSLPTVASLTATGTGIKWYSGPIDGIALSTATALATGTYYASQTVSGCESTSRLAVSVTVNTTPAAPTVGTITQPTCISTTGSVVLSGLPSGSWTINPGSITGTTTSTTINNLLPGTYNFTVTTNPANCTSVASNNVTITTQPATPTPPVVGTITQPTCALATGSVVLSGLPSSGNWILTRYSGTVTTSGVGTIMTISGLPSGSGVILYNFTVTNAAGCTSSLSENVGINPQPALPTAPVQTVDCSLGYGNAIVTVSSPTGTGYQYKLDAGAFQSSTSFNSVANGDHTITVRNSSGCETTGTSFPVTCGCLNPPAVTLSSTSGSSCGTTPVTVSANTFGGGATSVTITENGSGSVSPSSSTTSPFDFTYTPIAADAGKVVTITVTTNNPFGTPCTAATATYTLTVNAVPSAPAIGTITQPTCNVATGSVVLNGLPPTGTWTLTRSPGGTTTGTGTSTTISGLAASATYSFTVTSAANCTSSVSANVVINPQPATPTPPTLGTITHPTCGLSTGFVVLSGLPAGNWTLTRNPGGVTINWNTTSYTVSGLLAGTYTFTVTNAATCTSVASDEVIINAQPATPTKPVVGTIVHPTCTVATGSVVLEGLPLGTWTLTRYPGTITSTGEGTSATLTGLAAGSSSNYTVTNSSGCTSLPSSNVVINAQPATPSAPVVGTITHPTFAVPSGSVVLSGLPASGTWTLTRNPDGVIITGNVTSKTITGIAPGTYTFTVTNAVGCTSVPSANVVINAIPGAPIIVITNPATICSTETADLTLPAITAGSDANLTFTYWSDAAATTVFTTPNSALAGTYYIKGTTTAGYSTIKPVTVTADQMPVADAGPDQELNYMFGTTLDAEPVTNGTGIWTLLSGTGSLVNTSLFNTSVTGLSLGINEFKWTVTNGVCPSVSDNVKITVNDLLIPTLITPNGDAYNEYFVLRGLETLGKTELTIFNRNGAQVYKNSSYDNSWNGLDYNGNELPDDTYFYVIKSQNGKSLSGYIVIRR
jgi:large repetitive protein